MDLFHVLILLVAGFLGGILTALIGGASLVTFPAFLAVGLSPLHAIASNLTVLAPANLLAAFDDRGQLPRFGRGLAALVGASLAGAGLGAALLLITPAPMFAVLVPLLLGLATVLFAFSEQVAAWLKARGGHGIGASLIGMVPASIYGGYFGAGVGVIYVGVLSVGAGGEYRVANALKNLITGLNCVLATGIFAAQGTIAWPQTLTMMAGSLAGGLLGGRLGRVVPRAAMRWIMVAAGALLTAIYAARYWF